MVIVYSIISISLSFGCYFPAQPISVLLVLLSSISPSFNTKHFKSGATLWKIMTLIELNNLGLKFSGSFLL